ncbi:MAG: hypothetical protein ABIY55_31795 [Kofleriaceae bacterium]
MYTVVRFTSQSVGNDVLQSLGEAINAVRPAVFDHLHRRGGALVCDVHHNDDGSFADHQRAMLAFVDELRDVIRRAMADGMFVEFDVAIQPAAKPPGVAALCFRVSPHLMATLAAENISLMISDY